MGGGCLLKLPSKQQKIFPGVPSHDEKCSWLPLHDSGVPSKQATDTGPSQTSPPRGQACLWVSPARKMEERKLKRGGLSSQLLVGPEGTREAGAGWPEASGGTIVPLSSWFAGVTHKSHLAPPLVSLEYTQVIPENQPLEKLSLYQLWKMKHGHQFSRLFTCPLLARSANLSISIGTDLSR